MTDADRAQESRAIGRGALTNALGMAAAVLGFAFYLVAARAYGAATTGLYLLAWTTLDILSKLGILGLDRALLTLAARCHAEGDEAGERRLIASSLKLGLAATTCMMAVTWIGGGLLGDALHRPELPGLLRLMTFGLPFWTLSAVCVHVARAHRVMRYEIWAKRVAEPLVLLILAAIGGLFGGDETWLAGSFVVAAAVGAALSAVLMRRLVSWRGIWRARREAAWHGLFRFSAPIGLYDLLNLLLQRIDLFLVGRFLPAAAAGVYGLAQETAFSLKKVRQAFDPIVIPVISGARQKARREDLQHHLSSVTSWILTLDLLALGLCLLAGRWLLSLYGETFVAGFSAFLILGTAVALNGVLGVSELFILLDHPATNLLNSAVAVLAAAGLGWWLTPSLGMAGAASAILGAYLLMNGLRLWQVHRLYRLRVLTPALARPFGWFLLALGVALGVAPPWQDVSNWRMAVAVALFATIDGLGAGRTMWRAYRRRAAA